LLEVEALEGRLVLSTNVLQSGGGSLMPTGGVATGVVFPNPVIVPVIVPSIQFASQETPNERFVDHLYRDLFHTAPPVDTITWLGTQLDRGQVSYLRVAQGFTFEETGNTVVQDLFRSMLGRAYDQVSDRQSGLYQDVVAYLTRLLTSDPNGGLGPPAGISRDDLAADIAATREYYNTRGGGTDSGWITALYRDALHRPPTQAELTSHLGMVHGGPSIDVAQSLFGSQEHLQVEVNDFYQHFLHRPAEPQGSAYWVGRLQSGTQIEEVIAEIASSPEYIRLAQS
jgi:hypothetical protein